VYSSLKYPRELFVVLFRDCLVGVGRLKNCLDWVWMDVRRGVGMEWEVISKNPSVEQAWEIWSNRVDFGFDRSMVGTSI